jgi:hypothetical protein
MFSLHVQIFRFLLTVSFLRWIFVPKIPDNGKIISRMAKRNTAYSESSSTAKGFRTLEISWGKSWDSNFDIGKL